MPHPITSLILGIIVGLLLAAAQSLFSSFLTAKAISSSLIRSEAMILFGFLFKITILGLIFFALSKVQALHFAVMLISFMAGVTALLVRRVCLQMSERAKERNLA